MRGFVVSQSLGIYSRNAAPFLIRYVARMGKFAKLYKSNTWQRLREARLNAEPCCRMCAAKGQITPAVVVDHIKRHHGCWIKFADYENTQSLCKRCHDSDKQQEEWLDTLPSGAGVDGYPTDGRW